jgi:hypothetical protein
VSPLAAARAVGAGRVLVGAALMLAPQRAGQAWIGDDARRPGVQAIFRALGIRDLILGALTLHVAAKPGVGRRTVATCAVADAVDFGATLAVRDHIPARAAAGTLAVAGGAAVAGAVLAAALGD